MNSELENGFPAGLAKPALRALANAGITNLDQIAAYSKKELLQLHGIGPNAIKKLQNVLEEKGLAFSES
ncbi:hypothetical protein EIM92_18395 [Paenibacillus lentus]|uniref:DNA-binding protein n=2 Tax=Paenibacillus lentus TaxID=1338368 RepID=A0A3Q8S7T7_9BACL|nr:hypothetical protein EIM92_18395 [Paenibacillus lentus]